MKIYEEFNQLVDAFEKLYNMGVKVSLYMEVKRNKIVLHIADTLRDVTYGVLYTGMPEILWKIEDASMIASKLHREIEHVEIERIIEIYGEDSEEAQSDESESDYTYAELREKALPRASKEVAKKIEERFLEWKEENEYDYTRAMVYWQDELVAEIGV